VRIHDKVYGNTDEEYQAICDFLNVLSTQDPFMHWESGRMNYWRYTIHAKKNPYDRVFSDNVHLWQADNQDVVGLCLSEYGGNDMFIEVLLEYRHLYPDMFHWIDTAWARQKSLWVH